MDEGYGVIFDWDGVIIDSHDAHEASWERLAEERGKVLPEGFFKASFGMRNDRILPLFFDWVDPGDGELIAELGERKEALYREVLKVTGIDPLPGVRKFLAELGSAGVPFAVGSSTSIKNIETIVEAADLRGFSAVVAAEDVTEGKPHPEVFLTAAGRIGREPGNCVVFEDAQVGLDAAKAGGMKAVALTTTNPAEKLKGADLVVGDLSEITWERVRALWG